MSPDGKEVCFARNDDPVPATSTNAELWVVPTAGGAPRRIAGSPGYDGSPQYSPDGGSIAFRAQLRAGHEADRWRLMVYDRKSGAVRALTEGFDRHVDAFAWSTDSKTLFFVASDGGRPLLTGNDIRSCWAERGGAIAFRSTRDEAWTLEGNVLEGNYAAYGGGLYVERGAVVRLERSLIAGNVARESGGGIHAGDGVRLTVSFCTLVYNQARGEGPEARTSGALRSSGEHITRVNSSILWGNAPGGSPAEYRYSIVEVGPEAGGTVVTVIDDRPVAFADMLFDLMAGGIVARTVEGAVRRELDALAAACITRVFTAVAA